MYFTPSTPFVILFIGNPEKFLTLKGKKDMEELTKQITSAEIESSNDNGKALKTMDYTNTPPAINNKWLSYEYNYSEVSKKNKNKRNKKNKKKLKMMDNDFFCISQMDFMQSKMDVNHLKRLRFEESFFPPREIVFDFSKNSGFVIGKNLNNQLVGKPQDKDGHFSVIGGSGTGKTTGVVIPNFYQWKGRIFSLDFKGDQIKHAKKRNSIILYLCKNENNYFYVDPFNFLRLESETNIIANARALAFAIIPLSPNIKDPFWIQAAREILTGCLVYFFQLGSSFIEAMIYIKSHRLIEIIEKIRSNQLSALCTNSDLLCNEKTIAGISMELHNHISVFATDQTVQNFFSKSENDDKALLKWSILEKYDVVIRIDQSRLEQWNPAIRLMITQLICTLEKRPEKYSLESANMSPILLMLDEFPQLGKMEIIPSALRIIRSKAVTIAIFCQSLADLDEIYGAVTRRSILDNCTYKAILGANDAETQHYFSELVGTISMPKAGCFANFDSEGAPTGYGVNMSECREYVIQPYEFAHLSEIILVHPFDSGFCRLKKITHFQNQPREEE